ncbi:MAG: conjugal transfer protein TraG [Zetaproteobacteria bacterium CG1_02_53_45]|nr:MAG: conjugal transfer protein TraG [Zetaproteobacteria bacterium CG1_02_53_45]
MTTAAPLYNIPKAQGDMTKVVWPALGLFMMIVLLSSWVATEYVAWKLGWDALLGAPMFGKFVYEPWDILIWTFKFNSMKYGKTVLDVFEVAHLIMAGGGLAALLLPVSYAFYRTRKAGNEKNDLHGSAHWATDKEVEATKLLPNDENRGGVYFGAYTATEGKNKGKTSYLRHKGPEHMMVFAPTRSGKGVGIVIPTLLIWDESVLVHDIKGENWQLTSGFRARMGQRCIKFDPTSLDSARFNPLAEIRIGTEFETRDVQNIATMIVDPDGKGLNDHWAKTGFDLLTGVILHVLYVEEDKSLARVQSLLSEPVPKEVLQANPKMTGIQYVMEKIRDTNHLGDRPHHVAQQSAQAFLNKAASEASGVLSTALSFLSLYKDDVVADNTRVSDFTLTSLMEQKTSLYLVVPPSDKDRLKPLIRLIINQVTRRLTEGMDFNEDGSGKSKYSHRLLMVLDEFPSLGKLDIFQEALAFLAGYGIKALLITQDLSQLHAIYTKDESIMSNCHIRIAYAPNKIETAKMLSEMTGKATVTHTQRQYSGNRLAVVLQHVNTNEQIIGRSLLEPDEAMRLPANDEIVFMAGHAPIYCQKIKYYTDPILSERIKITPPATGRNAVMSIVGE